MDPILTASDTFNKFTELGQMQSENYEIDEEAALLLMEEMYGKLCCEDQTLRTFRRSVGRDQYIKKILIPLMINVKNEQVIEMIIRLMVNLTLPIECLFSAEIMSRTEAGRNNLADLCELLSLSKNCFTDIRATRAVVDYLKSILEKESRLSVNQCGNINNCLLLLRNVLHIPEHDPPVSTTATSTSASESSSSVSSSPSAVASELAIPTSAMTSSAAGFVTALASISGSELATALESAATSASSLSVSTTALASELVSGSVPVKVSAANVSTSVSTLTSTSTTITISSSVSASIPILSDTTSASASTSDTTSSASPLSSSSSSTKQLNNCFAMQNQVLWNLFTLSIDKLLIHLMSCSQRSYFSVAIAQLIALMYKDQHVNMLQKLLNTWFEASLSDSSEDFESNTTPMKEGSGNSSPMLTSDSSDNGGNSKLITPSATNEQDSTYKSKSNSSVSSSASSISSISSQSASIEDKLLSPTTAISPNSSAGEKNTPTLCSKSSNKENSLSIDSNDSGYTMDITRMSGSIESATEQSPQNDSNNSSRKDSFPKIEARKKFSLSELSDCGYGTQVENPETISTSSNEDDIPVCHKKPPQNNQNKRFNAVNNPRSAITFHDKKEWRRKKLVKRSKTSLINMKGLLHHAPSDEAISNILKEFTVDFLLKGYGYLVKELHAKLLMQSELAIQIDSSHFFWLITYFLKFAVQLELDLDHIKPVLSFDIMSYLIYEGVNLCEELEQLTSQDGVDIKSCLRRMHLVVTSIKEFLLVLDAYKRISHLSKEDKDLIHLLTLQVSATNDLQCLFVLLLRRYDPKLQSKQYLQDVIITNHVLLILLDEVTKYHDYKGTLKMLDHIEQFATFEVMQQYGLLLADFQYNGEFVNDCIFTMMHHVGGDVGKISMLFQPTILKTFSKIFEMEYELCDDWSDLIEYIMNKFINTPQKSAALSTQPTRQSFLTDITTENDETIQKDHLICDIWLKEEIDTLYWYYEQSKKSNDIIGNIRNLFGNSEFSPKSRIAVIQQLLKQDIITKTEYKKFMKSEGIEYYKELTNIKSDNFNKNSNTNKNSKDIDAAIIINNNNFEKTNDDIQILRERILFDNKGRSLLWLQKVLVDCCFVKLTLNKKPSQESLNNDQSIMEPVPFYYTLKHQSVPVVPWNVEQNIVLLYQPFMLLLHKLGFHLPADSGKMFVRIPEFWTADILYNVAEKLGPVDRSLLKFDLSELNEPHFVARETSSNVYDEPAIFGRKRRKSLIRFTPNPLQQYASSSNWPSGIGQTNNNNNSSSIKNITSNEPTKIESSRISMTSPSSQSSVTTSAIVTPQTASTESTKKLSNNNKKVINCSTTEAHKTEKINTTSTNATKTDMILVKSSSSSCSSPLSLSPMEYLFENNNIDCVTDKNNETDYSDGNNKDIDDEGELENENDNNTANDGADDHDERNNKSIDDSDKNRHQKYNDDNFIDDDDNEEDDDGEDDDDDYDDDDDEDDNIESDENNDETDHSALQMLITKPNKSSKMLTQYFVKQSRLPDLAEVCDEDNADDHYSFIENDEIRCCDTASITSNLTHVYNLYVSDEDDL